LYATYYEVLFYVVYVPMTNGNISQTEDILASEGSVLSNSNIFNIENLLISVPSINNVSTEFLQKHQSSLVFFTVDSNSIAIIVPFFIRTRNLPRHIKALPIWASLPHL
jgi:hypothetical protein